MIKDLVDPEEISPWPKYLAQSKFDFNFLLKEANTSAIGTCSVDPVQFTLNKLIVHCISYKLFLIVYRYYLVYPNLYW